MADADHPTPVSAEAYPSVPRKKARKPPDSSMDQKGRPLACCYTEKSPEFTRATHPVAVATTAHTTTRLRTSVTDPTRLLHGWMTFCQNFSTASATSSLQKRSMLRTQDPRHSPRVPHHWTRYQHEAIQGKGTPNTQRETTQGTNCKHAASQDTGHEHAATQGTGTTNPIHPGMRPQHQTIRQDA
jgi:hypothetical protein